MDATDAGAVGGVFELFAGPLSKGELHVLSFRGKEEISKSFRFDVIVTSEREPELLEPLVLAQAATLLLHTPRRSPRVIRGVVERCQFRGVHPTSGRHEYLLRVVPRMWLLKRRVRSRIFQNISVPDIVAAVLRELDVRFRLALRRAYDPRTYCVQYQESDYAFVTRLCAEEGLLFYVEPPLVDVDSLVPPALVDALSSAAGAVVAEETLETVVFADSADAYPPIADDEEPLAEAIDTVASVAGIGGIALTPRISFRIDAGHAVSDEYVDELSATRAVKPKAIHRRDWDFRHPTLELNARAALPPVDASARLSIGPSAARSSPSLPFSGSVSLDVETAAAIDPQRLEVFLHHGDYEEPEEPEALQELARVELEQSRRKARLFRGTSTSRRLAAGHRFHLDGHVKHELDIDYVVVSVEHEGTIPERFTEGFASGAGSVYRNRFTAVKAGVVYRPALPERRLQQVLESATVVGPANEEIYTDDYGRVKVQFHWDREGTNDDGSSCWIRVAQGWAGAGFGVQFIPRVGMEVLVSFLGGDEDRPIILGCVHNGVNPTPFRLPEDKTRSGIKTRSSPRSAGYNELSFEDAAGAELIYVHAQNDFSVDVEHDLTTRVLGSDRTVVAGRQSLEVTGDRKVRVGGVDAHTIDGPSSRTVGSDERIVVNGRQVTRIDGGTSLSTFGSAVENRADHRMDVEGSSTTNVGTKKRPGILAFFTEGREVHETSGAISLRSEDRIILSCGDNSIVVSKGGIRLEADHVVVKGRESVTIFGKGPATEWTDTIDMTSDGIHLYAKGASLELAGEAIKIESGQVEIGTDPEALEIIDTPPAPGTKRFKWKLLDRNRAAIKNKNYLLVAEGLRKKGLTDGEGFVEADIPADAEVASVTVWPIDYPTGPQSRYTFDLEDLPSVRSVMGALLRLKNLGYYQGKPTEEIDFELEIAIRRFQQDSAIPPTGLIDGPTIAALDEAHPTA